MSRDELALFLTSLVEAKSIKEEEATRLLALYDAGELSELDLPLSTDLPATGNEWETALLVVLLMLGRYETSRTLSPSLRRRTRDSLRAAFNQRVNQLAVMATSGNIAAWHRDVQFEIAEYTRQMAVAGSGSIPKAVVRARVDEGLRDQWAFLGRLGVYLAVSKITGERELSPAYIANRTRNQGGIGWGAYFIGQAEEHVGSYGWVEQWRTREDGAVCRRCAIYSRQYFLPGQGPIPGVDCYAGGACRCLRVPAFNESMYLELGGARETP